MPPDFSGQNLRGRSFKGRKDLTGANFSYADIRGADFTGAILIGANFSHAKAGLQKRWSIVLLIVSLFLLTLSGIVSAYAGVFTGAALIIGYVLLSVSKGIISPIFFGGIFILITLAVFFIVTIRKGLVVALVALIIGTVVAACAAAILVRIMDASTAAAAGAGVVAVTGAGAAAVVVTGTVAGVASVVMAGTIAGAMAGAMAIAGAVAGIGLSGYLSWQTLAEDEKYAFIQKSAIAFAATGGTSFRGANLTDANFTQATLKSTDFRGAIVTRTCWFQAKKLDFARVGKTYLETPQVRQLLITKEGQNQNFDNLPLRGVNLRRANLVDASFIGADLSEANLQSANLLKAKLKQTQLDRTDLTGAYLTGAYIEGWGITSETKIDAEVREYLLRRTAKKRRPRPEPPLPN